MPEQGQLRPATYRDLIIAQAKEARVPPELALAVADQESGGDPSAVSPKGARGFFQLMPPTAAMLGVDPTDPVQNIYGGVRYLRQMLDQHNGDVTLALAAYNAGPTAVKQAGGVPNYPETKDYVSRVLTRLHALRSGPEGSMAPESPEGVGYGKVALPEYGRNLPTRVAPPLDRESWSEWGVRQGYQIAEGFDPRTREGRRNLAGATGAALATGALIATAPVSLPVTGLAAGTAGVLGAMGGGMLEEAGEQIAGTSPVSTGRVLGAGAEQGAYELGGQVFTWPVRMIGRHTRGGPVHKAALEKLGAVRRGMTEQFQRGIDAATEAVRQVTRANARLLRSTRREAAGTIRAARAEGRAGVEAAQQAAERANYAASQAKVEGVQAAGDVSRAGVRAAGEAAETGVEAAGQGYEALIGQAPSAAQAGRTAHEVIEGPARSFLDTLGTQVDEVAKAGPDVDITALKQEAQRIVEQLKRPEAAFPRRSPESPVEEAVSYGASGLAEARGKGVAPTTVAEHVPPQNIALLEQRAAQGDRDAIYLLEALQTAEKAQAAAGEDTLRHPAMAVISRILHAEDTVPFYEAHLWKSQLQNALRNTYDKTMKSEVTNITQHLTKRLRESLSGFAPYDQATAAYSEVVKRFTKGAATTLRRALIDDPEALVRGLRADNPTKLSFMRDLLLSYPAEAGDAQAGQVAWDQLRASWVNEHVLAGGLDGLEKRLGDLTRPGNRAEFASLLFGDQSGQAVLSRLQQVVADYQAALATKPAVVEAAKDIGRQGVRAAKATGEAARRATQLEGEAAVRAAREASRAGAEQAKRLAERQVEQGMRAAEEIVEQAKRDVAAARLAKTQGKAPTADELAYLYSSIGQHIMTNEQIIAHGFRAIALAPKGMIWGLLSAVHLLNGPRSRDLLRWAAYSGANSTKFSRFMQALAGKEFSGATPTPMLLADIFRDLSVFMRGDQLEAQRGRQSARQVGTPPPTAGGPGPLVGTAPPGQGPGARR